MSVAMAAKALLYGRQADAGLVGTVYRHDPVRGATYVDRVTIPMVDFTNPRLDRIQALDQAEAGRYMVQLTLPDGKVVTQDFDIVEGEESEVTIEVPHTGPHEWTGLQAMTGQFAAGATEEKRGTFRLLGVPESYSSLRTHPADGFELRFIVAANAGDPDALLGSNALAQLAGLVQRDVTAQEAETSLEGGSDVLSPSQEDNDYAMFEFFYAGAAGDGATPAFHAFGPGDDLARAYLQVKCAKGTSLICLPVPWTVMGEEYENQLLLDKRSLDGEPEFTLTVADPMINSALGYIKNGALHEAARLIDFDTAKELLFNKISSPFAATIGGYLLVLGLDRHAYVKRSDDWKNWVDNLYHWFPWLPDGAILRAAMYFVLGDKDRDGAYEAIMAAYDRGLPYFTFGLTLLLEGMRRFADEGDGEAAARLKVLESIAAATDPSHNFVSLSLAQRWNEEPRGEPQVLMDG